SDDEIERDRFTDELRCEQSRGDGIDRHRVRYAGWRRSLKGEDPQDESKRAATNAEIDARNPLRSTKSTQDADAAREQSNGYKSDRAGAHADREKTESA